MKHLSKNPIDLVSKLVHLRDDDADLERRGRGVRLVLQHASRPFGGSTDFATGVGQANARGVAGSVRDFAMLDFHSTSGKGVGQALLGRRQLMKPREFNNFGNRDISPFDEIRNDRGKFSVREPTVLATTP